MKYGTWGEGGLLPLQDDVLAPQQQRAHWLQQPPRAWRPKPETCVHAHIRCVCVCVCVLKTCLKAALSMHVCVCGRVCVYIHGEGIDGEHVVWAYLWKMKNFTCKCLRNVKWVSVKRKLYAQMITFLCALESCVTLNYARTERRSENTFYRTHSTVREHILCRSCVTLNYSRTERRSENTFYRTHSTVREHILCRSCVTLNYSRTERRSVRTPIVREHIL